MQRDEGVELAVTIERVNELRKDVTELVQEERRTRRRLHQLEGLTGALVDAAKQRRRDEADRERRTARRLNVLTVVIAAAALFEPFLYHFATGR